MTYSKGYTKEDHRIATRMSRLRKKVSEGRATQMERAELSDYDRKKKNRARPPEPEAPRPPEPPVGEVVQPAPPAQPPESPVAPEVMTGLPTGEGEFVPPPLSVGAAAPSSPTPDARASTAPGPGSPLTSASPAGSAPKAQAPAMSKAEAEASGEMVAGIATQILSEFNKFNADHGAPSLTEAFLKMFHFSVKRMAVKYGSVIDEDQYDAFVIVGAGGFVGYNTWRIKQKMEKDEKSIEMKPAAPAPAAPPTEEKKANGSPVPGTVERAARTVWSGGPGDSIPKGWSSRRDFDPSGPY